MAKYNWTINALEKRLQIIDRMISQETDADKIDILSNDFEILASSIEDFYNNVPKTYKLLEGYRRIKEQLQGYKFIWEDIKNFRNAVQEEAFVAIPEAKRNNLSKDDILTITHDFYKTLNKQFYKNFMQHFARRSDHVTFRKHNSNYDFKGETITIQSLGETFISIGREHNLDDVSTSIHEFSHATSFSINPEHLSFAKDPFTEIDTLFMELIATDYLEGLLNDGEATLLKVSKHDIYCLFLEDLYAQIRLIEAEKTLQAGYANNRILKQVAEEQCGLCPPEIEGLLNQPDLTLTLYLTSYLYAIELYDLHQKDPEQALYYLEKIILLKCNNPLEYYSNIKRFGFIPNLHIEKFHKECKDDILKLIREKPQQ